MIKFVIYPIALVRFLANNSKIDLFAIDYTSYVNTFCERFNCTRDNITYTCTEEDFLIIQLTCPHVIKGFEQ